MPPILHQYRPVWLYRAITFLFDLLAIIYPVYRRIRQFAAAAARGITGPWLSILILLVSAAVFAIILLVPGNFLVEVTSDEAGLHIPFLWMRLDVPWDQIVDVKPLLRLFPSPNQFHVVRTRALTPFHRILGLIYAFSFSPSFIYAESISDSAELSRRIQAARVKAGV